MKYENFVEAWNDLDRSEKINLYNDWCREYNSDDEIWNFDEEFFEIMYGSDVMGAVRAVCYGNVNYQDEYIRLDAYGNLQSMSEYEAAEWADDYTDEIFEHEDLWSEYIDASDYEEEEDDDEEDDE